MPPAASGKGVVVLGLRLICMTREEEEGGGGEIEREQEEQEEGGGEIGREQREGVGSGRWRDEEAGEKGDDEVPGEQKACGSGLRRAGSLHAPEAPRISYAPWRGPPGGREGKKGCCTPPRGRSCS